VRRFPLCCPARSKPLRYVEGLSVSFGITCCDTRHAYGTETRHKRSSEEEKLAGVVRATVA
jgi:hypothetical protein